jgi:hypothetical protein
MSFLARVTDRGPAHIWEPARDSKEDAISYCGMRYWRARLLTPYTDTPKCKTCSRPTPQPCEGK